MACRACSNKDLKLFLSLGKTPLANNFLTKAQLSEPESRFPLELYFCENCKLVQLGHVVPPKVLFENYVYVTSTTNTFKTHFLNFATELVNDFGLNNKSLVVDIGSNDGLLLKGFQQFGVQVIGVEPAGNIAAIAEKDGVETINDFFNDGAVHQIIEKKGKADAVTANNVFAHINDIAGLVRNLKLLLKDEGIFVIEIQYFGDTIEKMTFDNIYHEHLSYFTLTSLQNFFKLHEMEIFKVARVDSHGGSLRVFVQRAGSRQAKDKSVAGLLAYEAKLGINNFELCQKFAEKVHNAKTKFVAYVKTIKESGNTICGYGAPAKANTLMNFCEIGHEYINYVVDDSPLKQNLFMPGTHIPVVSSKILDEKQPNYIIIFAWNFADEILKKTQKYAERGVKFMVPLPEPRIV